MHPIVSVIVPVYNKEEYLEKCIMSLTNQTMREMQIILVNDGSTDNSLAVCKKISEQDDRIVVIDNKNGGVSSARNCGLSLATGEYIGFVDPDDWVDLDMYQKMYEAITASKSEICMCNYVEEKPGSAKEVLIPYSGIIEKADITTAIVANMIAAPTLNSGEVTIMGSACRLLIRNGLLKEYGIQFDTKVSYMEDLLFCIETFLVCERVVIIEGTHYHYRVYSTSTVGSYKPKFIEMHREIYNKIQELLVKTGNESVLHERMKIRYVNMAFNSFLQETYKSNKNPAREKMRTIKYICGDATLQGILKNISFEGYTLRKKMVLKAIKKRWYSYIYLYYTIVNPN